MKKLYFECNSGISGDMTVAALLDLGADEEVLRKALESIPDQGFGFEISRVKKSGIACADFSVKLDQEHENHDHDMEYLHGKDNPASHAGEHGHHEEHGHHGEHGHHAEHGHHEEHGHHGEHGHHEEHGHHGEHGHHAEQEHHEQHFHRGIQEIRAILKEISMTDSARGIAERVFDILADAEAKAHGIRPEEVHFHEVGALDSIVDIVAAAVCIDNLGIREVIIPRLCEGTGTVRCQHGILPVPVPAVASILEKYSIPVEFMDIKGEFITPTGAALAAALMTTTDLPKRFYIKKIGMGAGKREYERPSILRVMLIEEE